MIREDLRKYIGEAVDSWCDDNNITENREERFKKEFLGCVDESFYIEYIEPVIESNDEDLIHVSNSFMLYMLCKEIVKGEIK